MICDDVKGRWFWLTPTICLSVSLHSLARNKSTIRLIQDILLQEILIQMSPFNGWATIKSKFKPSPSLSSWWMMNGCYPFCCESLKKIGTWIALFAEWINKECLKSLIISCNRLIQCLLWVLVECLAGYFQWSELAQTSQNSDLSWCFEFSYNVRILLFDRDYGLYCSIKWQVSLHESIWIFWIEVIYVLDFALSCILFYHLSS